MGRATKRCPHCHKLSYKDKVRAEAVILRIQQAGQHRDNEPKRSYSCPFGHGWHLTSQAYDPRRKRGGRL